MILYQNLTKILALIFFVTPYSFQTLLAAKPLTLETITRTQIRALKDVNISSIELSQELRQALEENNIHTLRELYQLYSRKLQFFEDIETIKAQIVYSLINVGYSTNDLELVHENNLENLKDDVFLFLYADPIPFLDPRTIRCRQFNDPEKNNYKKLIIKYQQTLEQASSTDFDILSQHFNELEELQIRGINLKDIISLGDLDELELPIRIYNQLIKEQIHRISKLCQLSEYDHKLIQNPEEGRRISKYIRLDRVEGIEALQHIKEALSKIGLSLNPLAWQEMIELGFTERVIRCLVRYGIYSVSQLVSECTEKEILEIRGISSAKLNEIKKALQTKNLTLKQN